MAPLVKRSISATFVRKSIQEKTAFTCMFTISAEKSPSLLVLYQLANTKGNLSSTLSNIYEVYINILKTILAAQTYKRLTRIDFCNRFTPSEDLL